MSDPQQSPQGPGQQWPGEQPTPYPGPPSQYALPTYQAPAYGPVPLWAPLYGASLPEAIKRFFKKYATFTGRASRSEYWWWTLVSFVVILVMEIITLIGGSVGATLGPRGSSEPGPGFIVGVILIGIWMLATIVPSLALTVRRLHDANFSGWMALLGFVPFVGGIILLVFTLMESKPEGQRFDGYGQQINAWSQ